ncbi:MAG: hypothetical protein JSW18_04370 [Candidatus Omnitrophota bacterium]|nr:MAG: hypothetical protein JSW18_04370 [Candidatus Omnitrophota bacterium]
MSNFAISADSTQDAESPPASHVIAYYFHGNFRCVNCYNIERYSKEAVERYFKDELASGKVVFKVVNIEEKGNEHFVNDYQLYTRSLVLSLVKNGKEIKAKNLTKVWEYLRNKPKFYQYVKDEVNKYLNEF